MFRRMTYANVASTLALFLAVGGSGFAVASTTSSHGPKLTPPKHPVAVTARGRGPRGFPGRQGRPGRPGRDGATGARGPAGPAGSALAYVHVRGGVVDAANSKNVTLTGLSTGGTSTCLAVAGTPHTVVAMIDNSGANPQITSVAGTVVPSAIASSGCPAGSNVLITTVESGQFVPKPFYAEIN